MIASPSQGTKKLLRSDQSFLPMNFATLSWLPYLTLQWSGLYDQEIVELNRGCTGGYVVAFLCCCRVAKFDDQWMMIK